MQNDHDVVEPWRSRVPPGVPGAGWLIGIIFVFSAVVFVEWILPHGGHAAIAAPAASAHTSK